MTILRRVLLGTFLFALVGGGYVALTAPVIAQANKLSDAVEERLRLRTSPEDELLHGLEQDFVRLLQSSRNPEALLEAEELLEATNDNTHWTNYSSATSVIRRSPDKAAIPLLLMYMVVHTKRSASHVMIPEYARTITLISGHEVSSERPTGSDREQNMRQRVQAIVNEWWAEESQDDPRDSDGLTDDQLRVITRGLLEEVRRNGDFSGSGGKHDSAYGAYHNVYYRVRGGSSSGNRFQITELHPGMVRYVLEPSGYRSDADDVATDHTIDRFPYETIPILGVLAKNGFRDEIVVIADDKRQNSTVRLACILSLFRAGETLRADDLMQMLETETDLEKRLIMLLSLRWAGKQAAAVLMKHMDDPSIEIAIAAACALVDARPDSALPKIKAVIARDYERSGSLVLNTLEAYTSKAACDFMAQMLEEALDNESSDDYVSGVMFALIDACDLPRPDWRSEDYDLRAEAKLALLRYREKLRNEDTERRKLTAMVDSLKIQLEIALKIESMRHIEYKRLLSLQGDDVVTAEESKIANDHLTSARAEVSQIRAKLAPLTAKLSAHEDHD